MSPNDFLQITILIIFLSLSSFFSASETALMSLSKIRIRHMLEEKIKGAEVINKLVKTPNKLLGAILIGNNIVNIGASAIATSLAIKHFGDKGVTIATGLMTMLVLIFGEITPKSLAANNSEKVALKVAKYVYAITFLLNPIIKVFNYITNFIIYILVGRVDKTAPFITEEELKTMVDVSHEEGVLQVEEKQMIHNIFDFGDSQVLNIMTPRTDMSAISFESTYDEILAIFKSERYSRILVYEDTIDNIIGILHVKDLVLYENNIEIFHISKYIKEPYYTYEYKKITELFEDMRKNRVSMAIVLDEYGGTAGLVTIEDLVEEIVGEILDEYDEQENEIEVIKEDEFIVDGGTKIDLVNEMLGINIESEDFDSIGGFVIGEFGGFPNEGEVLEYNNIKFIVESIDKNRIKKLKILT